VRNAEAPEWPVTAEDLRDEEERRDPGYPRISLVAEESHRLVGVATAGADEMAHREGRFHIDLRVPPDLQGQGIGRALYEELIRHLAPHRPVELVTMVWHALERANRFVIDRGFVETFRRIDSTLVVKDFDFTPYEGLEERVRLLGIEVKTYAGLERDPRRLEKLWELDRELWQDVPYGEPVTRPSLERFEKELIQSRDFLPEACFVAVCGDTFAGYSLLLQGEGYFDTDMTGVRRAYRGRGVATLLKLLGIRYALAHGGLELRTVNDSVNEGMLALNEKLGFRRQGASIHYKKDFPFSLR
jgi:GNAT superfamily N-acetyltransferase